jgi:Domain of unknown function (DUF6398)/Plasmid pRiA4b ORF-3-like protein
MAKSKKSEDVPKTMAEKFNSIVELTDEFARQHLNQEYAQLIRQATAALCRKRPSPLEKGQAKTWACGVTHAIGMVNFLFDSSQAPHISANELYQWFGVAASTGQGKSKQVRDTLKMGQLDPDWSLPSRMDSNPLIWMLSVNGLIADIRYAPLEIQVEAFRKGLIPYIPGHQEDSEVFLERLTEPIANLIPNLMQEAAPQNEPASRKTRKTQPAKNTTTSRPTSSEVLQALYVLEVALISGPVTNKFLKKNPQVVRTIEIRGDQTLADLHRIIFEAFDREEEHLYEFQLKGKGPGAPNADRYGVALDSSDSSLAGEADKTLIGTLDLAVEEPFGYWFDFGDDWWHQVGVRSITEPQPNVNYPRITHRIGASPPQYADL